jgi:hypothetical protein
MRASKPSRVEQVTATTGLLILGELFGSRIDWPGGKVPFAKDRKGSQLPTVTKPKWKTSPTLYSRFPTQAFV